LWVPETIWKVIRKWIPMPCVDIMVFNDKEEFLLLKRNNKPFKGEWWIPGGKIKKGDFPLEEFAIKKVKEETGLDVEIVKMIGLFYYSYGDEGDEWTEENLAVSF